MSKFIRFDEDHFGYLDPRMTLDAARLMGESFEASWPGKFLIILAADEFIDLTGQYEIVPIGDPEAAAP